MRWYAERATSKKTDEKKLANLSGQARKGKGATAPDTEITSTFRIFSRQYCNYVFPESIKRPLPKDYSNLVKLNLSANPSQWSGEQVKELQGLFDGELSQYHRFVAEFKRLQTNQERLQFLNDAIERQGKDTQEFSNVTSDEEQFIYEHLAMPASYQAAIDNSLQLLDERSRFTSTSCWIA